jgi:ABC-2 type transport system ATP-binding protein
MWRGQRASYVLPVQTAIEIKGLTKRFGAVQAVSDLDLTVAAGRVTGFLGPNGAGKSTTLRLLLGLIHPDRGTATFAGRTYRELAHASAHVGAVLEHASFHPGRTGRNHLRVLAAAGAHPPERVDDVLDQVGMTDRADRRVKGYSMGMRQRLAIGAALLGDPEVLILDEPTNGLDPPGIRWVRDLVRAQSRRGRAVLVSSHLLFEVAQSVDDVVVIAEGTLRAAGPLHQVLGGGAEITLVRTTPPDRSRLADALDRRGWSTTCLADDAAGAGADAGPDSGTGTDAEVIDDGATLLVTGTAPAAVGRVAADEGIALTELRAHTRSLEDAFLALTGGRS